MEEIPSGHTGLLVVPHHDDHLSNALLVECAMECRDLAMVQAVGRESTQEARAARHVRIKSELDSELDAMIARYYAAEGDLGEDKPHH